jgi:alpha-methylacyl-CoA racemase
MSMSDGVVQSAPAPRFSRSVPRPPVAPRRPGFHTRKVLAAAGYDQKALAALAASGVIPVEED